MAYTPCFRREAGAAGERERGLIRMHQFNKVEMFCFTKPEESQAMFELDGRLAPKRSWRAWSCTTAPCCSSPAICRTAPPAHSTSKRGYRDKTATTRSPLSPIGTDFQARRSSIRFKRKETKKNELVHTLNGSGLATSRLMVALLENNQNADGSVNVPKAASALPWRHY